MQKTIINSATKVWFNSVNLDDNWTGVGDEWQVPAGHEIVDGVGAPGHVWNGTSFDPPTAPPARTDAELDAEMDVHTDDPATLSVLEAIAARLPGPVSIDDLKADVRARGRVNLPR
jgi:hypothetical protein